MYAVELDRSKRVLVISGVQRVTAEQAKLAARRVRELLQDVAPGFRVLADYRWLESMDSAAARHVAEIMDTLAEKGVASPATLRRYHDAWDHAADRTPHGLPIELRPEDFD